MPTRRQFFSRSAAAMACGCCAGLAYGQTPAPRREVRVGGQRVRTVDIHCHVSIPAALDVVKGTPMERALNQQLTGNLKGPPVAQRLAERGADGIDVEAMSINPYWYGASRDMARRIIDVQNAGLAAMCREAPENLRAFASVALQFPDLAAEQLEHAVKNLGLCGSAIGGSVNNEEISNPKYDAFWKKAEELQALVFIHPQSEGAPTTIRDRVKGPGALSNVIGNPLETTFALAHLIFDGTLDKFPNLKICAAHGGGYLGSYANRSDAVIRTFPNRVGPLPKKKPTQYLKDGQLFFDTIVFTPEALRHLIAESGVGQIMIGTDYPFPWTSTEVDLVLNTPGLSDDDRIAILGGTAAKLMGIA